MLQVASESVGLEGGPDDVLVHAGGVFGPLGELVGVDGEGGLQRLDGFGVLEEEDLVRADGQGSAFFFFFR